MRSRNRQVCSGAVSKANAGLRVALPRAVIRSLSHEKQVSQSLSGQNSSNSKETRTSVPPTRRRSVTVSTVAFEATKSRFESSRRLLSILWLVLRRDANVDQGGSGNARDVFAKIGARTLASFSGTRSTVKQRSVIPAKNWLKDSFIKSAKVACRLPQRVKDRNIKQRITVDCQAGSRFVWNSSEVSGIQFAQFRGKSRLKMNWIGTMCMWALHNIATGMQSPSKSHPLATFSKD